MQANKNANGVLEIYADEKVVDRVEGQSLDGVDVSDYRDDLDPLAKLYNQAECRPHDTEIAKKYAALKQRILNAFNS